MGSGNTAAYSTSTDMDIDYLYGSPMYNVTKITDRYEKIDLKFHQKIADRFLELVNCKINKSFSNDLDFYSTKDNFYAASSTSSHGIDQYVPWQSSTDSYWYPEPSPTIKTPQERLHDIIRARQAPPIHVIRKHVAPTENPAEIRARQTLKVVLGDEKYREFLKNGFVTVRARSGLVYQIFPGSAVSQVYRAGKLVERLCVVLSGSFPPADSLIMRYLLILNDEGDFRGHAIKQGIYPSSPIMAMPIDRRPLPEIYQEIRGIAA